MTRMLLILTLCSLLITTAPDTHAQSDTVRILLEVQDDVPWDVVTLNQTVAIIEQRLNGLGFADVIIQLQGARIVVIVSRDAVNVVLLEALLKPGLLEFVDFSNIASGSIPEGACILTTEQVRVAEARLFEGETPNAYVDYTCADGSPVMLNAGQPFTTIMTGAGIADAVAQAYGQGGSRFIVNFVLKDGGEVENFTDFVANNPNQPMAIVLDGRLLSAPVIQASLSEAARAGTIDGGVITGNFTQDEARVLAAQIKYGIFPLPLQIISVDG